MCVVVSHLIHKGDYFINVLNLIRIYVAKKTSLQHEAPPTWPFVARFHSLCFGIDSDCVWLADWVACPIQNLEYTEMVSPPAEVAGEKNRMPAAVGADSSPRSGSHVHRP